MTESELTNEQKETLYCYLRSVDEEEQYAYTKGWIDCLEEYKYQEFVEKEVINKACKWLYKNRQNYDYINTDGDVYDLSLIEDFKKAMEE